jgi:hypothetical protein
MIRHQRFEKERRHVGQVGESSTCTACAEGDERMERRLTKHVQSTGWDGGESGADEKVRNMDLP